METIKGTVVKVTEQYIVLLTTEGRFRNIQRPTSEVPLIGQSFTHIEKRRKPIPMFKYASLAAALFLMIVTSFIFPLNGESEEVYIISLDINPSIEIATDSELHVIRAQGLNDEGAQIIESIDWDNRLYTVVDEIIDKTVEAGYIEKQVEPLIVTSVIPLQEPSEELIGDLQGAIDSSLEENKSPVPVSVTLDEKETYEEAKKSNLSVNYYKEYKQLEKLGIIKSAEEIKGKTISELKRMENQPKNKAKDESSQHPSSNKKEKSEQSKKPAETPAKQEQKQNQGREKGKNNENRENPARNKENKASERGKSERAPANPGKGQKENNQLDTPPGFQKRDERPGPPRQTPNPQNIKGKPADLPNNQRGG